MKAKITIMIEIDNEKNFVFDKSDNANYNEIEDLLSNATVMAGEYIHQKRMDEIDNEDD